MSLFEYYRIRKECKKCEKNLTFDMKYIDEKTSKLAEKIFQKNKAKFLEFKKYKSKISYWGSELYDLGGHTPCVINLAKSLFEGEKYPLFLTRLNRTQEKGAKALKELDKYCYIHGVNFHSYNFEKSLIEAYNKIIENATEVVILYIHQHDILATALIYLLKRNTNIKFIFFDHATHFPNIAMTLCDLILELLPLTLKTTQEKRKLFNAKIIGLQTKNKNEIVYYTKEDITQKRNELGIKEDELLTISGGSSYKYFDNSNSGSQHYEMIKNILVQEPQLKHLAITNLSKEQEKTIKKIFAKHPEAQNRLIIHPLTPNFEILFQCADLFIDSFPVSSAMTQLDLMSMKKPSVVKINSENPIYSFHEYMPENYPYMFESVEKMEKAILYLIKNKPELEKISDDNYQFWLENYEEQTVKEKYLKIIDEVLNNEMVTL